MVAPTYAEPRHYVNASVTTHVTIEPPLRRTVVPLPGTVNGAPHDRRSAVGGHYIIYLINNSPLRLTVAPSLGSVSTTSSR